MRIIGGLMDNLLMIGTILVSSIVSMVMICIIADIINGEI